MAALSNATMYSLHMCTDPFSYGKNQLSTTVINEDSERKQIEKSKCEDVPENQNDPLDWLLQAGLGPVVTEILLLLDPPSLHAAKQVIFQHDFPLRERISSSAPRCVSCGAIIFRARSGVGRGSGWSWDSVTCKGDFYIRTIYKPRSERGYTIAGVWKRSNFLLINSGLL